MFSNYTKTKNYKPDALYDELFRRHFIVRFKDLDIKDVIMHNVCTFPDAKTHIVSVEVHLYSGEIVFDNICFVAERNKPILFLTFNEKLLGL